jgi:hypothetical protein
MLDYAANAVLYWSLETIRANFEAGCEHQGDDPVRRVAELKGGELNDDSIVEEFWGQVRTNLRAGRVRMIFVADEIPTELRRIVEFLNAQMAPAEVLAVEISQYVGRGLRTLVPRVLGQTAEAQQAKSSAGRMAHKWDEPTFFEELSARKGATVSDVARQILEWVRPRVTRVWWGRGATNGSFVPVLNHKGTDHQLFAVWTYGTVEIYFQYYQHKPPFDSEEMRHELLDKLNAIPDVSLPEEAVTKRPGISLVSLQDSAALSQFLDTCEWVLGEIQAA